MEPQKILHIISGLGTGGAENMLLKLLAGMNREFFVNTVISLTDHGEIGGKLEGLGIEVKALNLSGAGAAGLFLPKLAQLIRQARPSLVQTWMYHGNLLGGLAARMAGNVPVVWNIRHSDLDPAGIKKSTILVSKLSALLSGFLPRTIISCSRQALDIHAAEGYRREKMVFIPNGFDLAEFFPDQELRDGTRRELGIDSATICIGLAGRFHPQKDHRSFIRAAALVAGHYPECLFLLCGNGLTTENQPLLSWLNEAAMLDRFVLLGLRRDMAAIHNSLDIAVSSSAFGEGFSNTIGEAMACGVPCVATDSGDSAYIIGGTGVVVEPRSPQKLAAGLIELVKKGREGRRALGRQARARVQEHFSLQQVVRQYQDLYEQVIQG